jgi:hypothetical protein
MPANLVSGMIVDDACVADLRGRFERILGQLRFLYEREKQFASQVGAMENVLAEAHGALRLPLQGYATQRLAPQGMWPDAWATTDFSCAFEPQQKMRGLDIELWVPGQLDGDQVLEVELDGQRWIHHVARGSRSRAHLEARRPAGHELRLTIRASRSFVPAQVEASSDDRELAFRLLGVTIAH